ncbi:65-kDa microtubule-associated protein 3 isoform X1 [Lolium perenne]|uniref:65-kDa microtubule-associated protein 3 isoform X1 n=1 Tax=Lolium perenne TaxID=4522 RepID=UPI0021F57BEB|nr:65-kDa microtubule-associated protein 3-like isoform X1 [Lolium perenne]
MEPRRDAVLRELGEAWDEVEEAEEDRRAALRALEDDCLALYGAKVAQVRHHAARLRAEADAARAELDALRAAIGHDDPRDTVRSSGSRRSLREQLRVVASELEDMRRRRDERRRELADVTVLIDRLKQEMRPTEPLHVDADGNDLTMKRLQDLRAQLRHLQSEKENRIKKMAELRDSLHASSSVLGMEPAETTTSLQEAGAGGDISDGALAKLESESERLRETKRGRMQRLQDLVVAMLELWSLMDTPAEEQSRFQGVACNVAASEDEITEPGALSAEAIGEVEAEVARLEGLKGRRMKDLLARKRGELREIQRRARIVSAVAAAEEDHGEEMLVLDDDGEGVAERTLVLARLDTQISEARDEEISRKDVLERMERWQAALEEETWLEEYSRNENRYNVGKGTHLVLKRAEKARAIVSKMPAMAESLMAKVVAWEKERGAKFVYDGEGLLDMLQEYDNTRKEKEQERKRQRDQRRQQGQSTVESPVARALPKSIKNVTRTLSMGGGKKMVVSSSSSALSSSRPTTPSYLKSALSSRRSDDGLSPNSFE